MRYFYEAPLIWRSRYGERESCDHPVYDECTLYEIGDRGLAVIQQRFDPESKSTRWGGIDPCVVDDLYLRPGFKAYFDANAGPPEEGLWPTVTVRQLMWALRAKPIRRQRWETVFDRRQV